MKFKYLVLLIIMAISSVAAQKMEFASLCEQNLTQPSYLVEVGENAEEAKKEICSAKTQNEMDESYKDFIDNIEGWFNPYGGFEEETTVVDAIKSSLSRANTSVSMNLNLRDMIQVEGFSFKPADKNKCLEASGAQDCTDVLDEFIKIHNDIQKLHANKERRKTLKKLKKLRAEWNPFLDQMRGQTPWELAINGQLYKNDHAEFSSPPSSQLIFLHPILLAENVSSAIDGEQIQLAYGFEVIGMNWWEQDEWYIPTGASLIAVYSDRAVVKKAGYGAAIHFQSNYTFSYTNHDGEHGFALSIDLVKWGQDKNKVFDSYRSVFD